MMRESTVIFDAATFPGLQFLLIAREALESDEGALPDRDDLALVFQFVWTAIAHSGRWKRSFQKRADEVGILMHQYGTLQETAAKLTDEQVSHAIQQILAFIRDAEAESSLPPERSRI